MLVEVHKLDSHYLLEMILTGMRAEELMLDEQIIEVQEMDCCGFNPLIQRNFLEGHLNH